jgi:hypothetical protein
MEILSPFFITQPIFIARWMPASKCFFEDLLAIALLKKSHTYSAKSDIAMLPDFKMI